LSFPDNAFATARAVLWRDLSSRPHHSPRSIATEQAARIEQLRRQHWTGVRIAKATGLSRATVSRVLTRLKLNTAASLQPVVPILRYEHPAHGDRLHIDIKKLARIHKPGHRLTGNEQDASYKPPSANGPTLGSIKTPKKDSPT